VAIEPIPIFLNEKVNIMKRKMSTIEKSSFLSELLRLQ
jgi:hypothetical protein